MERFTISLDDELARAFDAFIAANGYENRSEAVRDLIRARLEASTAYELDRGHCVASARGAPGGAPARAARPHGRLDARASRS
jgi:metal-responsive CopG/Arc/MetJ family transcriptional regulator